MVQLFKTHVRCVFEASDVAIYNASLPHRESIDVFQSRFVRDIGLTEERAFLEFNMAPLKLRRDIGDLGLLDQIQLGEAHPDFSRLFARK